MKSEAQVIPLSEYIWEIPQKGNMRVPGRVYADRELMRDLTDSSGGKQEWSALQQVINVACLPGIQKYSLALADVHPGYGFCIGGVGAFDTEEGVISVAGVGFDCNCGVRVLRTPISRSEIEQKKEALADELFKTIPAGVGSTGKLALNKTEINRVLEEGASFVIGKGYGVAEDLEYTEENGCMRGARAGCVSDKAKKRQFKQVGTLGSGNHYLEVQYIDEVYDDETAAIYGLEKDMVVVAIHCGSRGLGHQIGTDYLKVLDNASKKYKIPVRERELVCAPIKSKEGQNYYAAVKCGINCAFANRQVLAHLTRQTLSAVMGTDALEAKLLYDIGHNTVKLEHHSIDGNEVQLMVHRKGATRAFGPGRPELPSRYREIGQPVLVGGTMGTASFILKGTQQGMDETFGSAIHGAGRRMSRMKAKKTWRGKDVVETLAHRGILCRSRSMASIAEEAPGAYKDIETVVGVMDKSGIAKKVVRLRPLICIKG